MNPAPPAIPLIDAATRVLVKVCGFRDQANLREILALGVDAIGLNFWPQSKRFIDPATAATWLDGWPAGVLRAGVFVNPTDKEVLNAFRSGLIQVAQLHGNEPPEQCRRLLAAGVPIIKAVGLQQASDLDHAAACGTPYILADAHAPGAFGGTGRTVDWTALRHAMDTRPHLRLILSGGLHPGNVAAAIACVGPIMVDAASGVESSPGIKDPGKVRAFIAAARGA